MWRSYVILKRNLEMVLVSRVSRGIEQHGISSQSHGRGKTEAGAASAEDGNRDWMQVLQVSLQYFALTTTTQVSYLLLPFVQPHVLALCVRCSDMLERVRRETGIQSQAVKSMADAYDQESRLTIRQSMRYTPAVNKTIDSCTYRRDGWTSVRAYISMLQCWH